MHSTSPNNSALISAKSIYKSFSGHRVLEDIKLSIEPGQIVTLIGPNGAGKTTLVRIVLGLLQADSGEIFRQASLQIGYMPQKMHVESTMPLNVFRFLQLSGKHDDAMVDETLTLLRILHLKRRQLAAVSGGELQRVLLARALIRKPGLLILDEPAQGVDLGGQAELYALISEISSNQGCGVLMISHDLHLVMWPRMKLSVSINISAATASRNTSATILHISICSAPGPRRILPCIHTTTTTGTT